MIDRDIYFAAVRDSMFSGAMTQQQVDGQSVILALWDYQATGTPMNDLRWLAYMLATVFHECAAKMWPIREIGLGQGQPYGVPNDEGNAFYGRGFVQLTWEDNYDKASAALGLIDDRDLVVYPDLALDSLIAARILFRGMAEGWFTGKKLGQYFSSHLDDPVGARKIINPDSNGQLVADYHDRFLAAVQEANTEAPQPQPEVQPIRIAVTVPPDGSPVVVAINGEVITRAVA